MHIHIVAGGRDHDRGRLRHRGGRGRLRGEPAGSLIYYNMNINVTIMIIILCFIREFRDVVFEDVVFDNVCFYLALCLDFT